MTAFEKRVLYALSLVLMGLATIIRLHFGIDTRETYKASMGIKDELYKASDHLRKVADE